MEKVLNFLQQFDTSVLVLPLLALVIIIILWKLIASRKKNRRVASAEHGTALPTMLNLSGDRKLSEDIASIKDSMDIVRDYFTTRHLTIRSGPVALADKGLEIKAAIDAKSIFASIYPQLKILLVARGPLTPYDIQAVALDVAKQNFISLLSAEELGKLKQAAYKQGLMIESLYIIFGIMLRDTILKERKIQIDSLSARDPNIKK